MELNKQHKQLIERYLTGEEQLSAQIKAVLEEKEGKDFYRETQKVLGQVGGFPEFNEKEGWKKFSQWLDKKQRSQRWMMGIKKMSRYAAVILVAVFLGYSLQWLEQPVQQPTSMMMWKVPNGQVGTFTFPDGTTVTMNSGSSLSFSDWSHTENRRVLLKGEAFFKVAHNEVKPFIVSGGGQEVKVYGTQFNVKAYPEDSYVRTTLVEGLVSLMVKGNDEEHFLKPGQQMTFEKDAHRLVRENVRTDDVTLWMEGRFKFEDMPLYELIRHIERAYDLKVVLEDPELGDELFTGSFTKKESVERLLKLLEGASFGLVNGEKRGDTLRFYRSKRKISGIVMGPRSMI